MHPPPRRIHRLLPGHVCRQRPPYRAPGLGHGLL